MRRLAVLVFGGWLTLVGVAGLAWGQDPAPPGGEVPGEAAPEAPLRYRIDMPTVYVGTVESLSDDGELRLVPLKDPEASTQVPRNPTEGYFLGLAQPASQYQRALDDAKVLMVQVTSVVEEGEVLAQVDPSAVAEIEPGSVVSLLRPQGSTTALLQAAPKLAPLVDARNEGSSVEAEQAGSLEQSQDNLKQIGAALSAFQKQHGVLPPAVVVGPDGKAWHSWRVLILPFLEETSLADQYSFDEPWDGPNNRKLLEKTPPVYRDPIHGDDDVASTHYAAVVGKGTAFSSQGVKFDGTREGLDKALKSKAAGFVNTVQMIDGAANTLVAGSVSAEQQIPWTKPEDVAFNGRLKALGSEGSFAAPYRSAGGAAGVFLFGDFSVRTIRGEIKPDILRRLATIAGKERISERDVPSLAPSKPTGTAILAIEIVATAEGPQARLVQEFLGELEPPQPTIEARVEIPITAPSKPRPDTGELPADEPIPAEPAEEPSEATPEPGETETDSDEVPDKPNPDKPKPEKPAPEKPNPGRANPRGQAPEVEPREEGRDE